MGLSGFIEKDVVRASGKVRWMLGTPRRVRVARVITTQPLSISSPLEEGSP